MSKAICPVCEESISIEEEDVNFSDQDQVLCSKRDALLEVIEENPFELKEVYVEEEVSNMANEVNTLSIYIPKSKRDQRPAERLAKLSEAKERSINHLVVEAILQYLDREEKEG